MTTLTTPPVESTPPVEEAPRPGRERIFRRRGSGDFSKPTLGGLIGRYALLLFVLFLVIGPFVWQLSTSFKGPQENIYSFPPELIPRDPTLQNYTRVADIVPVYLYAWHSLLVSLGTVLSNVILATFAGYALGCMRFRGKWIVMGILLSTLLFPGEVTVTSNFLTIRALGSPIPCGACSSRERSAP